MSCFFDMVMPVLIQEDKKEWHIEEKTREMLLQDEVREEIGKKVSDAMFYNFDTNQIYDEETKKGSPFYIESLKPIQMPNMDMDSLFESRKAFSKSEFFIVLISFAKSNKTE